MFAFGFIFGSVISLLGLTLWRAHAERLSYVPKIMFRERESGTICELICYASHYDAPMTRYAILHMRYEDSIAIPRAEAWPKDLLETQFEKFQTDPRPNSPHP